MWRKESTTRNRNWMSLRSGSSRRRTVSRSPPPQRAMLWERPASTSSRCSNTSTRSASRPGSATIGSFSSQQHGKGAFLLALFDDLQHRLALLSSQGLQFWIGGKDLLKGLPSRRPYLAFLL